MAFKSFTKDPDAVIAYTIRWGALDWVTVTAYEIDDQIRDPATGFYYESKEDHTSAAAFATDGSKWKKVSAPYLRNGELLTTSAWEIETDLTGQTTPLLKDSDTNDTTTTTVVFSAGEVKKSYNIRNRVEFGGATEKDDRTITIKIQEK